MTRRPKIRTKGDMTARVEENLNDGAAGRVGSGGGELARRPSCSRDQYRTLEE